ncbi:mitochondrial small ribosomal subunit Rsm22-domain-containing protein [Gamsiella multidivaricata]|uniref:mitochondrial small ribosomal subunit Rsm22-domain-containing protein n=1 Tax=Gamsiella multidivaricata TaxID=101098 RepID=UPI00221F53DA|nr:mitochondrial small ribosomal subunit Rsm22-domain-containing protein [Gamsiella multidivaricata]KAI7821974.1 mitochondrial small ribosomal subunit Rsm22-domain-containing protein [Gamsiella multidivaricata]
MIPHDDRVTGQTREQYDANTGAEGLDDRPHHQRGSKEMDYGRKRIGQVEMPRAVQDAIRAILDEQDKSLVRTDALRLYGSLSGSGDVGSKGDKPVLAHILEYGYRESTAYIAAIAPTTYSAIKNVLEEVNRRIPDLQPKTCLDFGTGPGTAIWYERQLRYTGIDASMSMLETAEEILGSMATAGVAIPNVTFKPFLSHGSQSTKHDVVISAFTLSELTTPALRKSTLEHLWDSTNDLLILIDRGTPSGFKTLAEAREQILGLDLDRCPHDKVCPMYTSLARDSQWCHFSQKVQRPDFLRKTKHSKENFEDSKYTYVVLRKGARPVFTPTSDMFAASHLWSRIVVPPLKKDGHVVIDTCAANGYLERIIIPKSQGRIPYRDARKAMWGDLFPHAPKNKPVRKDTVKNMTDADREGDEAADEDGKSIKRRPLGVGSEALQKRAKQKEKKQSRQKVSLDQIDGTKSSRKGKKGGKDEDVFLEL